MRFLPLTLPSVFAGGGKRRPARQYRPEAVETKQRHSRQLTEAEQRLLDQKVAEARQQVRAEAGKRYATICRLCDRLGQPHLASQLISEGATLEQAVIRLCGHAAGTAQFPSNDQ